MEAKLRNEGQNIVKTPKNSSKHDNFSKYDLHKIYLPKPQNYDFIWYFPLFLWNLNFTNQFASKLAWISVHYSLILNIQEKNQKFLGFWAISRFFPSNLSKSFLLEFARISLFSFENFKICPSLTLIPLFSTKLTKNNFWKKSTFFTSKLWSEQFLKISHNSWFRRLCP